MAYNHHRFNFFKSKILNLLRIFHKNTSMHFDFFRMNERCKNKDNIDLIFSIPSSSPNPPSFARNFHFDMTSISHIHTLIGVYINVKYFIQISR